MYLVSIFMFFACSEKESDESNSDTEESALIAPEGMFTIQSYSINDSGCDTEGVDSLEALGHQFMFFLSGTFFGQDYVSAYSCEDEEACSEMQQAIENQEMFMLGLGYTFTNEGDSGGLTGISQSTGMTTSEGLCEAPKRSDISLNYMEDGSILIEELIVIGDTYPVDDDGYCNTDDAAVACENKECSQRENVILLP